jgi:hypothetical protein
LPVPSSSVTMAADMQRTFGSWFFYFGRGPA